MILSQLILNYFPKDFISIELEFFPKADTDTEISLTLIRLPVYFL